MKKKIGLIGAVLSIAGLISAETLNEWNFYSDPAGRSLSQAFNLGTEQAQFVLIPGSDESRIRTDGLGSLLAVHDDPGAAGKWTSGALLEADLPGLTAGVRFVRYDLEYNLASLFNDSGTVVGLAFTDSSGSQLAGVVLEYDTGLGVASPYNVTQVKDIGTDSMTGRISVVARMDLNNSTLSVWYDLTGTGTFGSEADPDRSVSVPLTSLNKLRFQATGDFRPDGSDDFVKVTLIRTTDTFSDAVLPGAPAVLDAKYFNEWTFERDLPGRALSETINTGTNSPLAQFSAGAGSTVFTTNVLNYGNSILCVGEGSGPDTVWTDGAILDAALDSATTGVHYLRYDAKYDFSSPDHQNGTVLGAYFTGGAGDQAAGLVLGYDHAGLGQAAAAAGRTLTTVKQQLSLTGSLTAIVEVDLDTVPSEFKVWYGFNGSTPTNYAAPDFTGTIALSSITNLRFHATGDFRPGSSEDFAAVDNIRHTVGVTPGGEAWNEVIEPLLNLSQDPILNVSFSDDLDGGMLIGQTNVLEVSIMNSGGPGINARTVLSYDTTAFDLIDSDNDPRLIAAFSTVVNTYTLVAKKNGNFDITAVAFSDETVSDPGVFRLAVGSSLTLAPVTESDITEVSGGFIPGRYEPGETIDINVTTRNNGGQTVLNITNRLGAANAGLFSITPASDFYPDIAKGATTSSTYQVVISPSAPDGHQTFYVTNSSPDGVWVDSFTLDVFRRGLPSVSTNVLTVTAVEGEKGSAGFNLINSGNGPIGFTIEEDGRRPVGGYDKSIKGRTDMEFFQRPQFGAGTVFTNWSGSSTAPADIGFDMPLFGTAYDRFSVGINGVVMLSSSSEPETASIGPLAASYSVDPASVRFKKEANRLVISWGNQTGREIQLWLHSNGTAQVLYEYGAAWGAVSFRLRDSTQRSQTITHTPGQAGRESLLLSPSQWITFAPSEGAIPGLSSRSILFDVDAAGQSPSTNTFNAIVNWTQGWPSEEVEVRVVVTNAAPNMELAFSPLETVVLHDSFNDGDRSNQAPPNSAQWFQTADHASFYLAMKAPGEYVYVIDNMGITTVRGLQAYFAPVGAPVSLSQNEMIRYSMDVTPAVDGPDDGLSFRVFLLNSGTERMTDDGIPMLDVSEGYCIYINPADGGASFRARDFGGPYYLVSSTVPYSEMNTGVLSGFSMSANTTYTITMDVERMPDDNVKITVSVSDGTGTTSASYIDDGYKYYSFDTIALANRNFGGPVEFDNMKVSVVNQEFVFQGPAGFISHANLTANNTGNSGLNYTITDSLLQSAGYTVTNAPYGWRSVPQTASFTLNPADLGTRSLNLEFPFVYFGNTYTSLVVNANGTLTLGGGKTISPFGAGLFLDNNAAVRFFPESGNRFTVTWDKMAQAGGASDQTFQAVLDRDGTILFNYQKIGSGWRNAVIRLTDPAGTVDGSLSNETTSVTTTNTNVVVVSTNYLQIGNVKVPDPDNPYVYETNVTVTTTHSENINLQSLRFSPSGGVRRVISASPVSGYIPAGGSANILITGDARSLRRNGPHSVTNNTAFSFSYAGQTENIGVTFIATNSASLAYSLVSDPVARRLVSDSMWGTDKPIVTVVQDSAGNRTLSWPAPDDSASREYIIEYTTGLTMPWQVLDIVMNSTSFIDTVNKEEPVIFYRVRVR